MTKSKKTTSFLVNPHFAAGLVKPFSNGARLQVKRLLAAQQTLKHDPVTGVSECYHEVSNLFEDLATVVHYLNLCGINSPQDQLFRDVRDHIRHDVREEFDVDKKRKKERAERLKLNPKLQLHMSFDVGVIRIGGIKIELSEITNYLNVADMTINSLLLGIRPKTEGASSVSTPAESEKQ